MTIIEASSKDLSNILNLQKKCYIQEAEIYNDFKIPPLTQSIESIHSDFEKQFFLKIEHKGEIVGSVRGYIDKETCKIGRLIVHPDFQNKGIGKKLMVVIEQKFSSAERFELFTGSKSKKNVSFYKRLGYHEYDRKEISQKLTLIFMEKLKSS